MILRESGVEHVGQLCLQAPQGQLPFTDSSLLYPKSSNSSAVWHFTTVRIPAFGTQTLILVDGLGYLRAEL